MDPPSKAPPQPLLTLRKAKSTIENVLVSTSLIMRLRLPTVEYSDLYNDVSRRWKPSFVSFTVSVVETLGQGYKLRNGYLQTLFNYAMKAYKPCSILL